MKSSGKIVILSLSLIIIYMALLSGFSSLFQIESLGEIQNAEEKELIVWGWDESLITAFSEYEKSHPSLKIHFTYVSEEDYEEKLRKAIASSGALPDICIISNETLPEMLSLDIFEDLEGSPYSLNREDLLEYSISNVEGPHGRIVAVPADVSAAGIAFRKSLAKKVIGTDSPNEVSIIFKSWADILSKAAILKEQYEDDFFLFAGLEDPGIILFCQTSQPYLENGVLVNKERFYNYFKVLCSLRDKNLLGSARQWSPQWYASLQEDCYLFYPCGMWLPQTGIFHSQGGSDWALTMPPIGSFEWMGSSWAIPKSSLHKKEAWAFIKEYLLSYGGAYYNKNKKNGVFIHFKPAYALSEYQSLYQEDFGEQNIGAVYFNELLPNIFKYEKKPGTSGIKRIYFQTIDAMAYDQSMDAQQAYIYFLSLIQQQMPTALPEESP